MIAFRISAGKEVYRKTPADVAMTAVEKCQEKSRLMNWSRLAVVGYSAALQWSDTASDAQLE